MLKIKNHFFHYLSPFNYPIKQYNFLFLHFYTLSLTLILKLTSYLPFCIILFLQNNLKNSLQSFLLNLLNSMLFKQFSKLNNIQCLKTLKKYTKFKTPTHNLLIFILNSLIKTFLTLSFQYLLFNLQLLINKNRMNYFPQWTDFKNSNQYNIPYFYQYGLQYPTIALNQNVLLQNYNFLEFYMGNNCIKQNYFTPISKEHFNSSPTQFIDTLSSQRYLENPKNKNKNGTTKSEKNAFKQKEGRNIISNLFRQSLKCILMEREKTIQTIEKISIKYDIEVNAKDFLQNLYKKTKNLKNYVRIGQIEMFLKGKQNDKSKQHAKVLRILIEKFLKQNVIPCLCNNPKVQNNNRMIHIMQIRKLKSLISS